MPIDYDAVANAYNRRYELHDYPGIHSALLGLVASANIRRVLELGCGTCQWLAVLASSGCEVAGIDPSKEMLLRAPDTAKGDLREGVAEALPWADGSFDLVCCVNAFHHFTAPDRALREAARVLRPGGRFLSIGLDPHESRDRWFVYDFFPEALQLDLERFPSRARRSAWLEAAGFSAIAVRPVEQMQSSRSFEELLRNGVLERSYTSQLTALTSAQFSAGLLRIRETVDRSVAFRFVADLTLYATEASKSPTVGRKRV